MDGSTLVLRGWAQGTSIFILPALCPPMEISMKTMGLPPAAPGIAPMPDIFLISELARFGCVARSYSARERRAPLPHLFMHDNR